MDNNSGRQEKMDKEKLDSTSLNSDYIVIAAGSDVSGSDLELGTYSYHRDRMLDEIDSSEPEISSMTFQCQNGDTYLDSKPATSVEEELESHKEAKVLDKKPRRHRRTKAKVKQREDVFQLEAAEENPVTAEQGEEVLDGESCDPHPEPLPTNQKHQKMLIAAVENDAPHMIDDLIDESQPIVMYEALLLSIQLGREHITKKFVKHTKYDTLYEVTRLAKLGNLHKHKAEYMDDTSDPGVETDKHKEDEDDKVNMDNTPIMLASLKDQYEVVQQLMSQGETIEEPHPLGCACEQCQEQTDVIRAAKARLMTYRALACDAYVVLASKDPIYRAFELRQKFQKLANDEKHYKTEYLELADQCRDLSSKILDKVQDGEELNTLLNETQGYGASTFDNLARLKLAIRNEEKKFVAHPACQKVLTTIWLGVLNPSWVDGVPKSLLFFLVLTLVYPFIALGYCIYPMNKTAPFLKTPLVKFAASTSAFLIFVGILMVSSFTEVSSTGYRLSEFPGIGPLYQDYLSYTTHVHIQDVYVRIYVIRILTILLCIWLLGMIWENIKKIIQEGRTYFSDNMFNTINFTSLLLYVVSFIFRFYALGQVESSVRFFSKAASWEALAANDSLALAKMYWLDADRTNWHPYEAGIISEAFFSLASILSITKITYVFTISERIGPLLLSLAKMLEDVFAFMVLFVFMIVAFVVGFHNLYWYYYSGVKTSTVGGSSFTSVADVIEFFFWSNFGLVNLDENTFNTSTGSQLTSITAYVLFGIYNWMMVIILINMLIAMMSSSYLIIAEFEDTEWKFARTKLFLEYMRDDSTLSSPYNLLPTWKGIYLLYKSFADDWCYRLAGRVPRKPREVSIKKFSGKKSEEAASLAKKRARTSTRRKAVTSAQGPSEEYQKAMAEIVKRFCSNGGSGDNSEEGIDQVSVDLSGLRQDLMSSIFRQDHQNALMSEDIARIDAELRNTRLALTEEHAHMKAKQEQRVVEMKSNMNDIDQHIANIFKRLSECVDIFEQKVTEHIQERTRQLQSNMTNVRHELTDINEGLEKQSVDVNKIQSTLLRQVDDVNKMRGTLSTLHSDVSDVHSKVTNPGLGGENQDPAEDI